MTLRRLKVAMVVAISMILGMIVVYELFSREVVLYENRDIDGYGFSAAVTCRPDEMFTYFAYVRIESPRGAEVARSQISGQGYEALKACRNSFPVIRLEWLNREAGVRVHFRGRNAFGDGETVDVPVRFFSPR